MLTIGNWSFDPASRALRRRGTERRLTPKASGVLQALAETPRQVWSRDALLERVWPDVIVGEEVLTHAIAELRTALGDHSRAPHFIETIHKSGYRLLCGATRVGATSGQVDSLSSADEAGLRLDAYGAYLDAETLLGRGGGGNARAALPLLSAALEAEPRFAPFRLAAARVRAYLAIYYAPDAAGLETALDQARIGLRLAPRSAEALAVHGFVLAIGGDSTRALRAFRAALEAAPEQASILYLLGRACLAEIGVASAAPILERAAALRGDDYHSLMLAGKARQIVGDMAGARRDFARALVRIETQDNPDDVRAVSDRARCLAHFGRRDEAAGLVGWLRAHDGPKDLHLACTFSCLDHGELALDTLEEVVDQGWRHPAWLVRDPDFARLAGHRRFTRLARAVGAN